MDEVESGGTNSNATDDAQDMVPKDAVAAVDHGAKDPVDAGAAFGDAGNWGDALGSSCAIASWRRREGSRIEEEGEGGKGGSARKRGGRDGRRGGGRRGRGKRRRVKELAGVTCASSLPLSGASGNELGRAGASDGCGSSGAPQLLVLPSVDGKGNHEDTKKKAQQLLQAAAKGASVTWGLQGLGGHVYQAAVGRPFAAGPIKGVQLAEPLALGCGDSTVRLWLEGTDCAATSSPGRQSLLWKGIPAKVNPPVRSPEQTFT